MLDALGRLATSGFFENPIFLVGGIERPNRGS